MAGQIEQILNQLIDESNGFAEAFNMDNEDNKRLFKSTDTGVVYQVIGVSIHNNFGHDFTQRLTNQVMYQRFVEDEGTGLIWTSDLKYWYNPTQPENVRFVPYIEEAALNPVANMEMEMPNTQ